MIEIFTDASYCYQRKKGGYAVWIKGDDMVDVQFYDELPSNIKNPAQAEKHAIEQAVKIIPVLLTNRNDVVVFWCDNTSVVLELNKRRNKEQIIKTLTPEPYNYFFNYLPRNTTPEHQWCDEKSKEVYK